MESNQGVEQCYVVSGQIVVHYFVLLAVIGHPHSHIRTKKGPIFKRI
jgi:hypothetical protein